VALLLLSSRREDVAGPFDRSAPADSALGSCPIRVGYFTEET